MHDSLVKRVIGFPGGKLLADFYAFQRSRVHVISYPKSGRTWLRLALGIAMREHFGFDAEASDLLEINRLARMDRRVPSIRFSHDDNPQFKTASELNRRKARYRSKDVVFLARDPRDVVVSSYYQHTRRAPHFGEPGFEGTLSEFIRHRVFGISTIVEFMNIWAENRGVPRRFTLVRYEDMTGDLAPELIKVLELAGIKDPKPEGIRQAVEAARFENMQAMERGNSLDTDRMRPTFPEDPDSFKVRRGVVGGHVQELSEEERAFVDGAIARLDPLFGYGLLSV